MNTEPLAAGSARPRTVVALLEAPKTAGGLECLRSLQMGFEVVFLTRNLLDYAKFDPEGLLGHVKTGNVIEVDTSRPLDVIGSLQEWTAESGLPVAALITHAKEYLQVCGTAASFLGLWCPRMQRNDMEPFSPPIQGMSTDPWAEQALSVNVMTVDGQHEFIALTGPRSESVPPWAQWKLGMFCMGLARTALDACEHEEGAAHVQVVFTGIHASEDAGRPHATVVGVFHCFSNDLGKEVGAWSNEPGVLDPFERAASVALGRLHDAAPKDGASTIRSCGLPSRGFVAFGSSFH